MYSIIVSYGTLYLFSLYIYLLSGKGIPNERASHTRAVKLPPAIIPECEHAVSHFESYGGHLTRESIFGCDPLTGRDDLREERNRNFLLSFPDFESIFHNISNNNYNPLRDSLLLYISLTERLSTTQAGTTCM